MGKHPIASIDSKNTPQPDIDVIRRSSNYSMLQTTDNKKYTSRLSENKHNNLSTKS